MNGRQSQPSPSLRNSMRNWRESGLPFVSRIGLAMRNNWSKLRRRSNCCGNYGQPGC